MPCRGLTQDRCAALFEVLWGVACPARFERATVRLEGGCSIQLSYGHHRRAHLNVRLCLTASYLSVALTFGSFDIG